MKLKPFTISAGLDQKHVLAAEKLTKLNASANLHELPRELVLGFEQQLSKLAQEIQNPETQASSITDLTKRLLGSLRTDAHLFPKDYYRNYWMGTGMAVFVLPFGAVFSEILKNFGFIGIGLPIGFSIGIGIGTAKDQEVKKEGRQLNC